jgi:hypothetical protein
LSTSNHTRDTSYLGYLLFQLGTHSTLFDDRQGPSQSTQFPEHVQNAPHALAQKVRFRRRKPDAEWEGAGQVGDVRHAIAHVHGTSTALERGMAHGQKRSVGSGEEDVEAGRTEEEDEEGEQQPEMNLVVTIGMMVS